jgi:cytidylate kinase
MNVIAIDGPGGSGKTTVSRALAARLDMAHLDTGAFYRAVTLEALRQHAAGQDLGVLAGRIDLRYEDGTMFIGEEDVSVAIRTEEVDAAVSDVSADPIVRREMVRNQRRWVAEHGDEAVVEGRDIGTVVFPHARLKVFLIARPEVRAARRAGDMQTTGVRTVQDELLRRDTLDSSRAVSPLIPAEDAYVLDTSDLDVEEVVDHIVELLAD